MIGRGVCGVGGKNKDPSNVKPLTLKLFEEASLRRCTPRRHQVHLKTSVSPFPSLSTLDEMELFFLLGCLC